MVGCDGTFLDGNEKISGFGAGGGVCIDDDAGALDGKSIRLTGLGLKCADQVEVRALAEIAAVE